MDSQTILDREYLEVRARILELAAVLDRLDRAEGEVASDPRMLLIRQGLDLIADPATRSDRAEAFQLLFSREYDSSWKENFQPVPRAV